MEPASQAVPASGPMRGEVRGEPPHVARIRTRQSKFKFCELPLLVLGQAHLSSPRPEGLNSHVPHHQWCALLRG